MNLKKRIRLNSRDRKAKAEAAKVKAEAEIAKGTKTGGHDNTVVSMDSDEETMLPPMKKLSLRQRITQVYKK